MACRSPTLTVNTDLVDTRATRTRVLRLGAQAELLLACPSLWLVLPAPVLVLVRLPPARILRGRRDRPLRASGPAVTRTLTTRIIGVVSALLFQAGMFTDRGILRSGYYGQQAAAGQQGAADGQQGS